MQKHVLCLIALCTGFAGCQSSIPEDSAVRSTVSPSRARQAAYKVERLGNGRQAAQVHGNSMFPLMSENAVVVYEPQAYSTLEPGVIVVYERRDGSLFCHMLVEKRGQAWVAQGINNPTTDDELVHRDNYRGVVYASFMSWDDARKANQ